MSIIFVWFFFHQYTNILDKDCVYVYVCVVDT